MILAPFALLLQLTNPCPPENEWQVVTYYQHPLDPGGPTLSHPEVACGRDAALRRKAQVLIEGLEFAPLSWQINWAAPSQVRGFLIAPQVR